MTALSCAGCSVAANSPYMSGSLRWRLFSIEDGDWEAERLDGLDVENEGAFRLDDSAIGDVIDSIDCRVRDVVDGQEVTRVTVLKGHVLW